MRIFKVPQIIGKIFPEIYWTFPDKSGHVFLTFDDGPDMRYSPKILKILEQEDISATFFVLGNKAEKNPSLTKQIHQGGHEIGIHSCKHQSLFFQSRSSIYNQLDKSKRIVEEIIKDDVLYFRPPYGCLTPQVIRICSELNLKPVMWNILTYDFDLRVSDNFIFNLIGKNVKGGAIIVLHDGNYNSDRTVRILESIIKILKEKGFQLNSISK